MAEIQAEKEREFDRVERRVKTKPITKPKPLPVEKPKKAIPELTKMGELVGRCVTCGAPCACIIRGFRVCKDPHCKYLAWTF